MAASCVDISGYVYDPEKNLTEELIYEAFEKSPTNDSIERGNIYVFQDPDIKHSNSWCVSVSQETRDAEEIIDLYTSVLEKLNISGFSFYATDDLYSPPYKYVIDNIQSIILKEGDRHAEEIVYREFEESLEQKAKKSDLVDRLRLFKDKFMYYEELYNRIDEEKAYRLIDVLENLEGNELEILFKTLRITGSGFSYDMEDYLNNFVDLLDYLDSPDCQFKIWERIEISVKFSIER